MTPLAILTRPEGRNASLAAKLHHLGWEVQQWPALLVEALPVPAPLPYPQDFDLVIFVSGNAARHYLAWLVQDDQTVAWPITTTVATVGVASAQAVRRLGFIGVDTTVLHPDANVPSHDSEALWQVLIERGPLPKRVLLVRGTQGRDWLANRLRDEGVTVTICAAYRRHPVQWPEVLYEQLRHWAQQGRCATWLLTSAEGIEAVAAQIEAAEVLPWWRMCRFVVTHPRLYASLNKVSGGDLPAAMVKDCLPADEAILATFIAT